jgi:hypothetical protein
MKLRKILGVGLLLSAPVLCVAAEPAPLAIEVTAFGGFRVGGAFEDIPDDSTGTTDVDESLAPGPKQKLKDSPFFGLTLNVEQTEDAYYEFSYSRQSTELQRDPPFDLTVEYLHLGGLLQFSEPNDRVIPYFALTVGATRFSPEQTGLDSETEFSVGVGGGLKFPITKHFGLRLEGRGYVTFLDSNANVFCASVNGTASCDVRVRGDTFFQAQALLGVTVAF